MFDEIGRSNRGALSGIASLARDVVNNWRIAAVGISSVASIIIGYNAVMVVARNENCIPRKNYFIISLDHRLLLPDQRNYRQLIIHGLPGQPWLLLGLLRPLRQRTVPWFRSFYALKAAMLANPVTAIIAGLFTLAGVLASVISYQSKATVKQKELNENLSRMSSSAIHLHLH